jgi:hypothetical protein
LRSPVERTWVKLSHESELNRNVFNAAEGFRKDVSLS